MTIAVTNVSRAGEYASIEVTNGTQRAAFLFSPGYVRVCSRNASNRAWGGLGREFTSMAEAREGYRSSAMQGMMNAAEEWANVNYYPQPVAA